MDNRTIIIFTDLDGSFLDHSTYSYDAALPALERLHNLKIPIIPVTSKTLDEIDDLDLPFGHTARIAENGMVIDMPDEEPLHYPSAVQYQDIINFIAVLPSPLRQALNGFHDMSVEDVMYHTGLPENKSVLAKARHASEPFLWSGSTEQMVELEILAQKNGLQITQGGRFYHLMGAGGKDKAIITLLDHIASDDDTVSIALGDGPNDAAMLGCVDYGVKIPNPHGTEFEINNPKGKIIQAADQGPAGWNQAINLILDELGLDR